MYFDVEHAKESEEHALADADVATEVLSEFAPDVENWNSYNQLKSFLYSVKSFPVPEICGTLKTIRPNYKKKPVTDEAAISWLIQNYEEARPLKHLLLRRKALKSASFLQALPGHCDDLGLIHTVLAPEADTGRLTSRNPNLQQIPADDRYGVRRAFIASPGHSLVVADYSQLELYVLAHFLIELFDDTSLSDLLAKEDIHSAIAKACWPFELQHIPVRDIKRLAPKKRQAVKAIVYGILYGKSDRGLGVAISDENDQPIGEAAAAELRRKVYAVIPGVPRYQSWVSAFARRHGGVPSLLGRWRPLPEAQSNDKWRRESGFRKAMNTPIQASAADIVTAAMVHCDKHLRGWGDAFILSVHDELIWEVPDQASTFAAVVKDFMEKPDGIELTVDLSVNVKVCQNWAEGK